MDLTITPEDHEMEDFATTNSTHEVTVSVSGDTTSPGSTQTVMGCKQLLKKYCKKALTYLFALTLGSCECWIRNSYKPKDDEDKLKEKLGFHFLNPFQKWNYKYERRFPWKLCVQLTCIFFVTTQLVFFATTKFYVTDFVHENTLTFTKLFVANPVEAFGPLDPTPSPIAYLYTVDDVLNQINYTSSSYFNLQKISVGTYGYEWMDTDGYSNDTTSQRYLILNVTKYASGKVDPTYLSVGFKNETVEHYFISESDVYDPNDPTHSIADAINWEKLKDEVNLIKRIDLQFKVTSISTLDGSSVPRCFQFTLLFAITKDYDGGSLPMTLNVQTSLRECRNGSSIQVFDTSFDSSTTRVAVDALVIVISITFTILCGRSLYKILHLAYSVRKFFKQYKELFKSKIGNPWNQLKIILYPLFDIWHVVAIISCSLSIIGSILKLLLSYDVINDVHVVDWTSIILGVGVFGHWCGLLRYLSYYKTTNILLLTLRRSAPNVLWFVFCTGILYVAFLLCGWLVMGPYHPKFRTWILTTDCLFSLINGDDMFNTYRLIDGSSLPVYIFSKIYIYTFVALFIYVVLSVFISLIEDTYRTLHEEWLNEPDRLNKKGFLHNFVAGQVVLPSQGDEENLPGDSEGGQQPLLG